MTETPMYALVQSYLTGEADVRAVVEAFARLSLRKKREAFPMIVALNSGRKGPLHEAVQNHA